MTALPMGHRRGIKAVIAALPLKCSLLTTIFVRLHNKHTVKECKKSLTLSPGLNWDQKIIPELHTIPC